MKTRTEFLLFITTVVSLVGTGCDMNDAATTSNKERHETSDIADMTLPEGLTGAPLTW